MIFSFQQRKIYRVEIRTNQRGN